MSITDELRKYAQGWRENPNLMDDLDAGDIDGLLGDIEHIADLIDAEHQKAIRKLNNLADASVLLPVDVDGVPIHVGDMMGRGDAHGRVIALMLSNYPKKWGGGLHWGVQLEGEHAPTALDSLFRHYHAPTVEDVLQEMLVQAVGYSDANTTVAYNTIAEYAAKLRLAESEDA